VATSQRATSYDELTTQVVLLQPRWNQLIAALDTNTISTVHLRTVNSIFIDNRPCVRTANIIIVNVYMQKHYSYKVNKPGLDFTGNSNSNARNLLAYCAYSDALLMKHRLGLSYFLHPIHVVF